MFFTNSLSTRNQNVDRGNGWRQNYSSQQSQPSRRMSSLYLLSCLWPTVGPQISNPLSHSLCGPSSRLARAKVLKVTKNFLECLFIRAGLKMRHPPSLNSRELPESLRRQLGSAALALAAALVLVRSQGGLRCLEILRPVLNDASKRYQFGKTCLKMNQKTFTTKVQN